MTRDTLSSHSRDKIYCGLVVVCGGEIFEIQNTIPPLYLYTNKSNQIIHDEGPFEEDGQKKKNLQI